MSNLRKYATTPRHQHDCGTCAFVGGLFTTSTGAQVDVYLHGSLAEGTLIARTGSEGPDYAAVPMEILNHCAPVNDEMTAALALLRALN